MSARLNDLDATALQGRLGTRVAAALGEQAAALPHDISERLRAGREQAVARAMAASRAAAPAPVGQRSAGASVVRGASGSTGTALGGAPFGWGWRLASVFPLVVLLVGLLLIEHVNQHEQVMAAADIDAVLLADELPPDAYADPGFAEFLKTRPGP